MRSPTWPLVDPSTQQSELFLGERVSRVRRRHVLVGIGIGDSLDEQTVGRLAGHNTFFFANTPSSVSKWNFVSRCFSSGP